MIGCDLKSVGKEDSLCSVYLTGMGVGVVNKSRVAAFQAVSKFVLVWVVF